MGMFINTGNWGFGRARNGEYIDKSGLIEVVNKTLYTENSFSCITRSRRFGKSMAAKMLCAYYDQSCDSRKLFEDLAIAKSPSFEQHLNKYPVIYLDLTTFAGRYDEEGIINAIQEAVKEDVVEAYPEVKVKEKDDLMATLLRISEQTGRQFIFIIDEWDAVFRELPLGSPTTDEYVNWLRRMFKDMNASRVFAGVYMTGILPIKKYNTQSALNNFIEYSMVDPRQMACFFGFTKDEVRTLAAKHGMDFDELEKWYDGYQIGDEPSMFNPNSVMQAVNSGRCRSYWASTGAFDAVSNYIQMNFEGLKDDVINMLAGGRVGVNTKKFQNDMSIIRSKDDVLTVLIHLGYLSYDWTEQECYIPNMEVSGEMSNAIESTEWTGVIKSLEQSKKLRTAALRGDEEFGAAALAQAHDDNTSILSYNDENSLSCVMSIAYYYARNDYVLFRELPSGKGFADLALLPRKNVNSPAIVVELKNRKDASAAIDQILHKDYPAKLRQYAGNILLVGINYDPSTKHHTCIIQKDNPKQG